MKSNLTLAVLMILLSSCSVFQSKEIKTLSEKVDSLTRQVDSLAMQNRTLDEEFTWIENELMKLNSAKQPQKTEVANTTSVPTSQAPTVVVKQTTDWQCLALTSSGKRCSRAAIEGSKYCWQHKKTYEPNSTAKEPNTKPSGSSTPEKK